jgi:hypothetical protein
MLPFGASAVAVSYAYFMKSAAQRLGPTPTITRPQGVSATTRYVAAVALVNGDVGLSSQEAHPLNNRVFPLACFELSQGSTLWEPAQARSDMFVY